MLYLFVAFLQAVPASPPLRIDLLERCAAPASDEILICGNRDAAERYRLRPLPDSGPAFVIPKAEIPLFGDTRAAAETESEAIGPGLTSNRIMLRLKTPF